ncbi:MAG: hypothetical protein IPO60_13695 [Flavobacteriales bacterium]|nr:hypothetical protein [Flavobacteriales bacterium]
MAYTAAGCTDTISHAVTVWAGPGIGFTATPFEGCAPLVVTLDNQSTGDGMSFAWDLGDGGSSVLEEPGQNTYYASLTEDTTYTITLTATNFAVPWIHPWSSPFIRSPLRSSARTSIQAAPRGRSLSATSPSAKRTAISGISATASPAPPPTASCSTRITPGRTIPPTPLRWWPPMPAEAIRRNTPSPRCPITSPASSTPTPPAAVRH